MAKQITFGEAVSRYGDLVTTNISIEDAIQEAVDRIYEMGRWPGTTVELTLTDDDFVEDTDLTEFFVYFNEDLYDGVIGFRNDSQGYSIMDKTALYKRGRNAGDLSFVDYGPVNLDVTSDDKEVRKYRCPLGWSVAGGPYYALVKLESLPLSHDDTIPLHSLGALKHAVMAVCYEYVGNDEAALLSWQKFEQSMNRSTRQNEGPKKYYVGTDSSLKRRPNQFM